MPDGPTLLDAVLDANRRRAGGDASARAALPPGVQPFVITCMDPRIVGNLIPALGLEGSPPPQAKFAGGVVRPGDDACVRSVLAAALLNMATEVLIVGHTDCRMGKISSGDVRSGLQRLGIRPESFRGEEPARWLGAFVSERASVQSSVDALRADPRMPARFPIHGLLFNVETGRLDAVVNGYAAASASPADAPAVGGYRPGPMTLDAPPSPSFGAPLAPAAGPRSPGPAMLAPRGPVPSLDSRISSTAFDLPAPPPFAAPPPPPVPVAPPVFVPPPPLAAPPPAPFEQQSLGAPLELSERPVSSHPTVRDDRDPSKKTKVKRKPGGGSSPFDRANEVLERLRRDKGGPL